MRLYLVSLGCDKNRVDSEVVLADAVRRGHTVEQDPAQADVIIVNTCSFIESATTESIDEILAHAEYKKTGNCQQLIVMGCLAERFRAELKEEIPEIDLLIGTHEIKALANLLPIEGEGDGGDRFLTTPGHYAYVKIAEGCDNHCTYCVIPSIRGRYVSRPAEDILKEATALAESGVKELIVIAQDTTRYGEDLYDMPMLPQLLRALAVIPGIEWIRLLYAYPESISDALIETMAEEPKICKYIDMPIQHASDNILTRMGRKTSKEQILEKIDALRTAMPDIAIRTTLIAGFPGETEADFDELRDFVADVKFDRLGVFPYSKEEGTPAAKLPDQIADEIKVERANLLMEDQQDVHFTKNETRIGSTVRAIVEHYDLDEEMYYARTEYDAPDVDCGVYFTSEEEFLPGDFVTVTLAETYGYDLQGKLA